MILFLLISINFPQLKGEINESNKVAATQTLPTFSCPSTFFQVITGDLKAYNPADGTYGDPLSDLVNYNAGGYNITDNYLYAIFEKGTANEFHLIRIGSDGTYEDLGQLDDTSEGYVAGDVDDDDNLYVRKGKNLLKIENLSMLPVGVGNTVTTTELGNTYFTSNFSGQVKPLDLAFVDGAFYAVRDRTLFIWDVVAKTRKSYSINGTVLPSSGNYGAVYTDNQDRFYISNNDGGLYLIEGYTTTTPTAKYIGSTQDVTKNDGFACMNAASPIDQDVDDILDLFDLDVDGDGIPNIDESPSDPLVDNDNDGVYAYLDDNDNAAGTGNDDGLVQSNFDTDGDGIADFFDLDSDNDGIYDAVEAGHGESVGVDGRIVGQETGSGVNGLFDDLENTDDNSYTLQYTIINSDNSGAENFQVIDADGDGCNDTKEASFTDGDNDGILGSSPITTDGDGLVTSGSDGYTVPGTDYVNNGINTACNVVVDTDSDGIADSVEMGGPNSGDANNDGTPDYQQSNVVTIYNLDSSGFVTLEFTGDCDQVVDIKIVSEESLVTQDSENDYPFGLVDFTLKCTSPGEDVKVTYHWHELNSLANYTYRKFGPNTPGGATSIYQDFTTAYGTKTIDATTVATASYTLTDGVFGDVDSQNGQIIDPAGPALASSPIVPVSCRNEPLIVFANPNTPSQFNYVDVNNPNVVVDEITPSDANGFNALAYNVNDNLLYMLVIAVNPTITTNHTRFDIVTMQGDGTMTNLGKPTSSEAAADQDVTWTTDIDQAVGVINNQTNEYYLRAEVSGTVYLVTIDLNTFTYTDEEITGGSIGNDLAYSNADGQLYFIRSGQVGILDPATASVSFVTLDPSSETPVATAGGAWSDAIGNVYFYENGANAGADGIYKFNPISKVGTYVGTTQSYLAFNATSCLAPILEKTVSTDTVDFGTSFDYEFKIVNGLPASITVDKMYDLLDIGSGEVEFVTGTVSPPSPGGGTVFNTSSELTISNISIPANDTVSFTIEATSTSVPSSGNFENRAFLVFGSDTSGSIDVSTGLDTTVTYIDNTVVASDNDNDGVADVSDLDDDNDGILDSDECGIAGAVMPQTDAISWISNNLQLFAIGGNTNGLGYQESGFEKAAFDKGYVLTNLTGSSDFSFTGNTGAGSAENSIGTFSNGTLTYSTSYTTTDQDEFRTTTSSGFTSGNGPSNGVYIFPEKSGSAGDFYTVTINFTTPVTAFSFDLIDIFDTETGGNPNMSYEVYVDDILIGSVTGNVLGDDATGNLSLLDGDGNLLGSVLSGQNIENNFGFVTETPVSKVAIRHIINSGSIISTARDPHGLDALSFSTTSACTFAKDLDSDDDGCSDANEAYASANADGGDGDQYGTGDPLTLVEGEVDAEGRVTGLTYITSIPNAVTNATDKSACDIIDNDNDGIPDADDLDDDNDGIPDIVEGFQGCEVYLYEGFEGGFGNNLLPGVTITGQDVALFDGPNGTGGQIGSPLDGRDGSLTTCAEGEQQCEATIATYPYRFSCGGASNLSIVGNNGLFLNSCNTEANLDADGDGVLGELLCFNSVQLDTNSNFFFSFDLVNVYPGPDYNMFVDIYDNNGVRINTLQTAIDGSIQGSLISSEVDLGFLTSGTYSFCIRTTNGGQGLDLLLDNFSICRRTNIDTDKDGIADYLDLDSDNDGCLDADEAGHGQVVSTDSTIAGPYGDNGLAASVETNDLQSATVNYTLTDNGKTGSDSAAAFLDSTFSNACGTLVAVDDTASTTQGQAITITILDDDSLTGFHIDTAGIQATASNGSVTVKSDGTLEYTPIASFLGLDTIQYVVCDTVSAPNTTCDTALVFVTVTPDNDGDGVADVDDLDDDNDGILDTDEGYICFENAISGENRGTFGTLTSGYRDMELSPSGYAYSPGGNTSAAQYIVTSGASPNTSWNVFGTNFNGNTTGLTDDAYLLVNGSTTQTIFYEQTITVDPNATIEYGIDLRNWAGAPFNTAGPVEIDVRIFDSTGTILLDNSQTGLISQNTSWETTNGSFNSGSNTSVIVRFVNISTAAGGNDFAIDNFKFRQLNPPFCQELDTDLDGIANHLDLDSDGDGCSDADEAGHSLDISADSTIAGPYGNNGLAASVETNDLQTAAVNYTLAGNGKTGSDSTAAFLDSTFSNACGVNTTSATDDILNLAEATSGSTNLLTNDEDGQGDNQTPSLIGGTNGTAPNTVELSTASGTAVLDTLAGEFTFTPNANFTGEVEIPYYVCDDNDPQACDTAIVFVNVIPAPLGTENNPPIGVIDVSVIPEDSTLKTNVLPNDLDPDGDNLMVTTQTNVSTPEGGTVSITPDGEVSYTPQTGFTGVDTITYEVCDNGTPSKCANTKLLVEVIEEDATSNELYASDDAGVAQQGKVVSGNLIANDIDPEGDSLVVNTTPVTTPSNGSVTIMPDGSYQHTPSSSTFIGTDVFTYEVCDTVSGANKACDTATVVITIIPEANTTNATDDILNVSENTSGSTNLLTNDEDAQGDNQTLGLVGASSGTSPNTIALTTTEGTAVLDTLTGEFTFTPSLTFTGELEIPYYVCDDNDPQACDTATVFVNVIPNPTTPGNNPPVGVNDIAILIKDSTLTTNVISNDLDPDGDSLKVTSQTNISTPEGGTVSITPEGEVTYTPSTGFIGIDTITYEVCDNGTPSKCDNTKLIVEVIEEDPTENELYASDDAGVAQQGKVVSGNLIANDIDPEGDSLVVNTTPVTTPSNGSVTIMPDGSYQYTPSSSTFIGTDVFTYEVCDTVSGANKACDTATVVITIIPEANTTNATDDILNVSENTSGSTNLLTNDEDAQGDNQTLGLVGASSGTSPNTIALTTTEGTAVLDTLTGEFTFTPSLTFTGELEIPYYVCDDNDPQACDTATVFVNVIPNPTTPGNNPPVGVNDIAILIKDSTLTTNVISNDLDPDGDSLKVTSQTNISTPEGGTVSITPEGEVTYTPSTGFIGIDTITYEVCDNGTPSKCDNTKLIVEVIEEDPTENELYASDDAGVAQQGKVVSGNLIANDIDPEGDSLVVNTTPVTTPSNGSVTIMPDGSYQYTPSSSTFIGTDVFTYEVCDTVSGANKACDTATVVITIIPEANTTNATDDILNVSENTSGSTNLLTNDEDAQGDNQTLGLVGASSGTSPNTIALTTTEGTAVLDTLTGEFTFTPSLTFTGELEIPYYVCDDNDPQACDTATVFVNVIPNPTTPGNNPPVGVNDIAILIKDSTLTTNVISNDLDPDGDSLKVTSQTNISTPEGGTVSITPEGEVTYTPATGFIGTDTITYEVCDNGIPSKCDQAEVIIEVIDNDPSVNSLYAMDDAGLGQQGDTLRGNVLINDVDPEGDDLIISISPVLSPLNGSLTVNSDGTYQYVPTNNTFVGTDVFTYQVCDDGSPSVCDTATVVLTIIPSANGTDATDDILNVVENISGSGNVLTNDNDSEGNQQIPVLLGGTPASGDSMTLITPNGGTVTLDTTTGGYVYVPAPNFEGEDEFTIVVCDDHNPVACDTSKTYINVIPYPVSNENNPPVGVNDVVTVLVDSSLVSNVLTNDLDPDGDSLTVTPQINVSTPEGGTVSITPEGEVTYTPPTGFVGTDTVIYEVCDKGKPSKCDLAELVIKIVEEDPTTNSLYATDDANSGEEGQAISGNVLTNDLDPEGNTLTVNTTAVTSPSYGSVVINSDGTYTYTPTNTEFIGTDVFTYEVCDNGSPKVCDVASVVITVLPEQNTTNATDDILNIVQNVTGKGNVLTNDGDEQRDQQTPTLLGGTIASGDSVKITTANGGIVTLDTITGTYVYVPASGFEGEDEFSVVVCDNGTPVKACDTSKVYINVIAEPSITENDPPVGVVDVVTVSLDSTLTTNVLTNDLDPDGDSLTVTSQTNISTPKGVTVSITPEGIVTYVPATGFTGTDTIVYEVCDKGSPSKCDETQLVIEVIDNDPSENVVVAVDDAVVGIADEDVLKGDLLGNDYDPEGGLLTINTTPVTNPTNGSVTIGPDGSFSYEPNSGFVGTDVFTYEVCDNGSPKACDTATVVLTVLPANEGPVAMQDVNIVIKNGSVSGNILVNDFDPESDPFSLSTSLSTTAQGGSITVEPITGEYTYTPPTNFVGMDSVGYSICDSKNKCDIAYLVIEVIEGNTISNDPPLAVNDNANTFVDQPVSGNVLSNDKDPEGDDLTITNAGVPITTSKGASITINADGGFNYVPASGFEGKDTINYELCDENSPTPNCDQAQLIVVVTPDDNVSSNDAPFAQDDADVILVGDTSTINLLVNDSEPNGNALVVNNSPINVPGSDTVKSVTINADGSIQLVPADDFIGTIDFKYEVCDDQSPALCDTASVVITVLENNAPIVLDTAGNPLSENTPITETVQANVPTEICVSVMEPDGHSALVSEVLDTTNGKGVLTNVVGTDSCFTYTGKSGTIGNDTIKVVVCDTYGNCDTVDYIITIQNDPPLAGNETVTVNEDETSSTGNILDNNTPTNGDDFFVKNPPIQSKNGSSITYNPTDSSFTYVPLENFSGQDTILYQVCEIDIPTNCVSDTVFIEVLSVNDAPKAADNFALADIDPNNPLVNSGITATIDVLSNDKDEENDLDTSSLSIITNPLNGSVTVNADGTIDYTPNAGFVSGLDSLEYQICDNGSPVECDKAWLVIEVPSSPYKPFAMNDSLPSVVEGSSVTGSVLGNDFEVNGDPYTKLELIGSTIPDATTEGTVTLNPTTGEFEFIPVADFSGDTLTVSYELCDKDGCDTAEIIFYTIPVNDPPVVDSDTVEIVEEGTPVSLSLDRPTDIDSPDSELTIKVKGLPLHGTVTKSDGTPVNIGDELTIPELEGLLIEAPEDIASQDTVQFTYVVNDGQSLDQEGVATIIIKPINDAPVANNDQVSGPEGSKIVASLIGDNDTDVDGTIDSESITLIDPNDPSNTGDKNSPLVVAGLGTYEVDTLGNVTFTPEDKDYYGDASINYTVKDDSLALSNLGEIQITVNSVNDAPIVYSDTVEIVEEGTPVSLSLDRPTDVDSPDNELVIKVKELPLTGKVTKSDGTPVNVGDELTIPELEGLVIEAPEDIASQDTVQFTYVVNDGKSLDQEGTAAIIIKPINDAPVANNNQVSGPEGSKIVASLIGDNDTDVDGTIDSESITLIDPNDPSNTGDKNSPLVVAGLGTYEVDGLGNVTFTPEDKDYYGDASINYTVKDDQGLVSNEGEIEITINPVNDLPSIVNEDVTVYEDGTVSGNILDNDTDIDGSLNVSTTPVVSPSYGNIQINPDGSYTYTPNNGYSGNDMVVVQVCDNGTPLPANCLNDTLFITVIDNLPPLAKDDKVKVKFEESVMGNVLNNDTDPENDGLSASLITTVSAMGGSVSISSDGVFDYTAPNDSIGFDSIQYVVCDTKGGCDTAYLYIEIGNAGDRPRVLTNSIIDGTNDAFLIDGYQDGDLISGSIMRIYNRWGNLVYESPSEGYSNNWKGTANWGGKSSDKLPAGTYYYVFDFGNGSKPLVNYIYLSE